MKKFLLSCFAYKLEPETDVEGDPGSTEASSAGTSLTPQKISASRPTAWWSSLLHRNSQAASARQLHGDPHPGDVQEFIISPSTEPSRSGARMPCAHDTDTSTPKLAHSLSHHLTGLVSQRTLSSLSLGHSGLHGPISQTSLLSGTHSYPDLDPLDSDLPDRTQSMLPHHSVGGNKHQKLFPSASMQSNRIQPVPHHLVPLRSDSYRSVDALHHLARNDSVIRLADPSQALQSQQERSCQRTASRKSGIPFSESDLHISLSSTTRDTASGPRLRFPHASPNPPRSCPSATPSPSPSHSPSQAPNPCSELSVSPSKHSGNACKLREHRQKRQLRQLRLIQNITLRSGSTTGVSEQSLSNRSATQLQFLSASPLLLTSQPPVIPSSRARSTSESHDSKGHRSSGILPVSLKSSSSELFTASTQSHCEAALRASQQQISSDGSQRFSSHTPASAVPQRSLGSCLISLDGSATGSLVASSQRSYICANDPMDQRFPVAGAAGSECGSETAWNFDLPGATLSYLTQQVSRGSSFLVSPGADAQPQEHPSSQSGYSPRMNRTFSDISALRPACGFESLSFSCKHPVTGKQSIDTHQQQHGHQQQPQEQQQQHEKRSSVPESAKPAEALSQGVPAGLYRREGINSMSGSLMGQYALLQSPLGRVSVGQTHQSLSQAPAMTQPQALSRLQHTVVSSQRVNGWGSNDLDTQPDLLEKLRDSVSAPVSK